MYRLFAAEARAAVGFLCGVKLPVRPNLTDSFAHFTTCSQTPCMLRDVGD